MQTAVAQQDLEHIFSHTGNLWDSLRDETIFITGGTGFFGKWLLESLAYANAKLELGIQAVVLTRNPNAFFKTAPHLSCIPAIRFIQGDVQTFHSEEVRAKLGKSAPERYGYMIHAGTQVSATLHAENPLTTIDTIVQGTRAALEFAIASQTKRFLLTSSGAVYGKQPTEIVNITEGHLSGPDCAHTGSAYGEAKRLAELLCVSYYQQYGLEATIARCFSFVGPHLPLDGSFAIGNFIHDALNGKVITVKGDGTPLRSYLYAADLAVWLWTILIKGQPCRPYNVGSEETISIKCLADTVAECLARDAKVAVEKSPDPNAPIPRYVPSTNRCRVELGLEAWTDLKESIRRTGIWNKKVCHPQGMEPSLKGKAIVNGN